MTPTDLIRDMGRKYPQAWKQYDQFRENRGKGGFPDWPAWCWCPMAAAYAIATSGNDDRLPQGTAVSWLAAAAPWRMSQGIYRIHPALVDELVKTPMDGIPTEWLHQLPEWCIYLDLADFGVFAHLESDANTGRAELRFLLDLPGGARYPVILHLGHPTIEEGVASVAAEVRRQQEASYLEDAFPNAPWGDYASLVRRLTALVVYVIAAVQDGDCRNAKTGPGRPVKRSKIPNHPETWDIGWKQGEAFLAAQKAASDLGGESSSPRPHVRRAHWHSYWTGPRTGERKLEVRWLPPIFVGTGETIPTVRDV